jgi:SAM-dependent methyltransferase
MDAAFGLAGLVLSPPYLAASRLLGTPGLAFRRRCRALGLRQLFALTNRLAPEQLFQLLVFPMDSVRYFEFDFAWRSLMDLPVRTYLDVSSPRLLPLLLVQERPEMQATVLNPDRQDLPVTTRWARAMNIERRCRFESAVIAEVDLPEQSMDAVTSISVLEHVPDDRTAVRKIWSLVKPGGRLILTVPCARAASEEYIDQDKYGLLQPDDDGFVFWQRYYDQGLLQDRIFSTTGAPARLQVYGEKRPGLYSRNVARKMRGARRYPFWREPYMMAMEYRFFDSIDDLPGMGVIGLEFRKV